MATASSTISTTLRDDPRLRHFYLEEVTAAGKTLGVGCYGSVVEVGHTWRIACVAKPIHNVLFPSYNEVLEKLVVKYQKECQLMADMQHSNVARFYGLCFLEGSELPLLVTERLEKSVHDFLEHTPDISLQVKISILTDTCNGLNYLHTRTPPIVHRGLTAQNVLLTSSHAAKISDVGSYRLTHIEPERLDQSTNRTPWIHVYLPLEHINHSHSCGPSLDMFSFGNLSLFTLTQIFPADLLSSTYINPINPDEIIARSEVDRRQTYMATLETTCAFRPVLIDLVKQCLHNSPEKRPSSEDVLRKILAVKSEVDGVFEGSNLELLHLDSILYGNKEEDEKSADHKGDISTAFPLDLNWSPGPDMPTAMSGFIQSVHIDGTVYVGGGRPARNKGAFTVMAYNIQSNQWDTLPKYDTKFFGMTVMNHKLVLVGGRNRDDSTSNKLGEWQPESNQWTHPFPPMSTQCSNSSVVSYRQWLIVAGGGYRGTWSDIVEILDVNNLQWSMAPSLPNIIGNMKSTVIGGTWYLMGGGNGWDFVPDVYSVSLKSLVSHTGSKNSDVWKKLPSLTFTSSCPVEIGGHLLAFGGKEIANKEPLTTVRRYAEDTGTWELAGELPSAAIHCTCIVISNTVYVMGGQIKKDFIKNVNSAIFQ